MAVSTNALSALPSDWKSATLLGRAWIPGNPAGPSPITVRPDGTVIDLAASSPTASVFLEWDDVAGAVRTAATTAMSRAIGSIEELLSNSRPDFDDAKPRLLAPCDLQAIKAAGVTFIASTLERVIENRRAETRAVPRRYARG
jgi:fumarylacetoacetate (FAA) hydrolase family protein